MRLLFGALAVLPELLGVFVSLFKARRVGEALERTPIKSDRSGIEKPALGVEQSLVAVVPFLFTELVVVENLGAEIKIVRKLLDRHFGSVGGRDLERGVGLTVFFDIRVDFALDVVVPDVPISLRHHLALRGESAQPRKRGERDRQKESFFHFFPFFNSSIYMALVRSCSSGHFGSGSPIL